jgi:hypothetical protein
MFFFLTLFLQDVWGYSPVRTALAYLPFVPANLAGTVIAQRAVPRIGPRPLLIGGGVTAAGGMFWLSRISAHSSFAGGMLGPEMVLAAGLGVLFMLVFLVGLAGVEHRDAGAASSLVNVGQQIGSSIGLAVVGTVAWSAVASSLRSHAARAATAGARTSVYDHALAAGFSRGYLVSAAVLALAAIIALTLIRLTRHDLSGPARSGRTAV